MASFRFNALDNVVIIKDSAKGLEYIDTLQNAEADSGQSFPTLPGNVRAFYYTTSKSFAKYSDGESERAGPYPVASIEAAIVSLQVMIDAQTARNNPPPTLAELRQDKKAEIKAEAVTRISAQVPALENIQMVQLMAELWPLLNTGSASAELLTVRDLYQFAKSKIQWASSASAAQLAAYDPAADTWPA